tara:strand:- start:304 stop:576 length:273 start_codon:yes stop_codon:yes gene_type:complete
MLKQYLNKPYVQSLIIGVLSSVIYKLINRNKDEKNNVGFIALLKVFFASTVATLFVLYTVNFKMGSKLKQVGGSLENLEPQQIMTGKPAF